MDVVKEYVKQFKGPEECYKHSCKLTCEAIEQVKANITCILKQSLEQ